MLLDLAQVPDTVKVAALFTVLGLIGYLLYRFFRYVLFVENEYGINRFGIHFWLALAGTIILGIGIFSEPNQFNNLTFGLVFFAGSLSVAAWFLYKKTGRVFFALTYPLVPVMLVALMVVAALQAQGNRDRRVWNDTITRQRARRSMGR